MLKPQPSSVAPVLAPGLFPGVREITESVKASPLSLHSKSWLPLVRVPLQSRVGAMLGGLPAAPASHPADESILLSLSAGVARVATRVGHRAVMEACKTTHPGTSLLPGQDVFPSHG